MLAAAPIRAAAASFSADKHASARAPIYKAYRELRLKSWESFLKFITDAPYTHWAFRGEQYAEWPLYSALSRYLQTFGIDRARLAGAGGAHPAHLQTQGPPVSAAAAGTR